MGKKQFCFFQTAETGNRTPDSGVKGSGANHYPRAPAHSRMEDSLIGVLLLRVVENTETVGLKFVHRLQHFPNSKLISGRNILFNGKLCLHKQHCMV